MRNTLEQPIETPNHDDVRSILEDGRARIGFHPNIVEYAIADGFCHPTIASRWCYHNTLSEFLFAVLLLSSVLVHPALLPIALAAWWLLVRRIGKTDALVFAHYCVTDVFAYEWITLRGYVTFYEVAPDSRGMYQAASRALIEAADGLRLFRKRPRRDFSGLVAFLVGTIIALAAILVAWFAINSWAPLWHKIIAVLVCSFFAVQYLYRLRIVVVGVLRSR